MLFFLLQKSFKKIFNWTELFNMMATYEQDHPDGCLNVKTENSDECSFPYRHDFKNCTQCRSLIGALII